MIKWVQLQRHCLQRHRRCPWSFLVHWQFHHPCRIIKIYCWILPFVIGWSYHCWLLWLLLDYYVIIWVSSWKANLPKYLPPKQEYEVVLLGTYTHTNPNNIQISNKHKIQNIKKMEKVHWKHNCDNQNL